jgi:hypothetical protein
MAERIGVLADERVQRSGRSVYSIRLRCIRKFNYLEEFPI